MLKSYFVAATRMDCLNRLDSGRASTGALTKCCLAFAHFQARRLPVMVPLDGGVLFVGKARNPRVAFVVAESTAGQRMAVPKELPCRETFERHRHAFHSPLQEVVSFLTPVRGKPAFALEKAIRYHLGEEQLDLCSSHNAGVSVEVMDAP